MIRTTELTIGKLVEFLVLSRNEDLEELKALTGHLLTEEPISRLKGAQALLYVSPEGKEELLGIGGVDRGYNSLIPEDPEKEQSCWIPWLATTTNIYKHPAALVRWLKKKLKALIDYGLPVSNIVYKKNLVHLKLLEGLGCEWVEYPSENFKCFLFKRREGG